MLEPEGLDIEVVVSLHVSQSGVAEPSRGAKVRQRKRAGARPGWIRGDFLRGPIPLAWLSQACRLGGPKTLVVALALRFMEGLRKSKEGLKLTSAVLARFGVTDRSTKSRALAVLEEAGLVKVVKESGKNPLVTILEVESGRETRAAA